MSIPLHQLPPIDPDSGLLNVIIDTPKGSRNKYKFDEKVGQWRLSKVLPQGACFPFDFGFIPSTKAGDGDPLDVLLLADEPTFPGCIIPSRLIGVFEAEQTEKNRTIRNDRLVAVLETKYNRPQFSELRDLAAQTLDEIEHFFIAYNQAEGRIFKPLARRGSKAAYQLLERSRLNDESAAS